MESIVWEQESPLWDAIKAVAEVPQCEDVSIPNQLSGALKMSTNSLKLVLDSEKRRTPISGSKVFDRTHSPNIAIKKKLFNDAKESNVIDTNRKVVSNASNGSQRASSFALFFRKVISRRYTNSKIIFSGSSKNLNICQK